MAAILLLEEMGEPSAQELGTRRLVIRGHELLDALEGGRGE
jgi:hypothetical protein